MLEPLRSPHSLVFVDNGASMKRTAEGWEFMWSIQDVNSMWDQSAIVATESLLESGPPVRMTADELDTLARELGREPASLWWCRERRLVERIIADDVDGVLAQLAAMGGGEDSHKPTLVMTSDGQQPILTVALGVMAWTVAAELVRRGEPPLAPPKSTWDAASYVICALDDSAGAARVLQLLLERGAIVPSATLLCHVRAPQIARMLIAAGVHPDDPPSKKLRSDSPEQPGMVDATPLTCAVVGRRLDVADALLAGGASVEARDKDGCNPLIVAVRWGNEEPVRWLLEHGANPRCAPDAKGRTPLSLAQARPQDPGSQVLLAALGK